MVEPGYAVSVRVVAMVVLRHCDRIPCALRCVSQQQFLCPNLQNKERCYVRTRCTQY